MLKKETNVKNATDINILIEKKIFFFQDTIQKTLLYVQKNKIFDILGVSDVNNCINILFDLSKKIQNLNEKTNENPRDNEYIINELQLINNELSSLSKLFGTESFEDLLSICFGNNIINTYDINDIDKHKFDLLKRYFHPTSYKVLTNKKEHDKSKLNDGELNERSKNLDCSNISTIIKPFHLKVYGIQVIVHNISQKKSLLVTGIVDDVFIDILNNKYINNKLKSINDNISNEIDFNLTYFERFLSSLILKDFLILSPTEIYSKYMTYVSNLNNIRSKNISQITKDFLVSDLYFKRLTIIQLLIYFDKNENQYLAYLLYDILSNDSNGVIDTEEQTILFDSFPWIIKQYFRDAMKNTIQYTSELSNFESNKIPIEQQICLLKTSDSVKEKAMQKLKEIKSKTDDSGSKARQYLDGLLKIPFDTYRKEPILNIMTQIKNNYCFLVKNNPLQIDIKDKYTNLEIYSSIKNIKIKLLSDSNIQDIKKKLTNGEKKVLIDIIQKINELIHKYNLNIIIPNKFNKKMIKEIIENFIDLMKEQSHILFELMYFSTGDSLYDQIVQIENNYKNIHNYMKDVFTCLDESVFGHPKAKKQIAYIIGQWINGSQDGYCFGFEGPPGVGKTSLAKKGLSNCLKDEDGNGRPFAMIQMGGDSNGSSLHGHNYTYVGSNWGSIVQILIDKKCMNPIIFIDEIDKISKTEHGKEIIGILTHLLDPTQNDVFQDKYFTGIDLDLSKALFILSYNDADAIDRILLDRIHRIKFTHLSLEDKLVICKTHIFPEIYAKMGLENMIIIEDDVIKIIIDQYTREPGVRKLKEIIFEIIGEINLDILMNKNDSVEIPIKITMEDIYSKYLKDKHKIIHKPIFSENRVGFINGLWANALGQGGVIPIQTSYYPADKFLQLKLTGMQGDVMKESMNVALTLAWSLTCETNKKNILNEHKINQSGIHIHCPEGAVPKDGPSAGTAISVDIYSLLNNLKIKNTFAITGEISLDGCVSEIGGLDLKILGGIKSGIKEFIYPKENEKDFKEFMEKYSNKDILNGILFHSVEKIQEVFDLIFE
jgi:ATP-dependent Lon protease